MITVTNTAPTNTLTPLASPVVDSAQTTQATAQGTASQDGFSSALNGQLNLAAPSTTSAEVTNAALLVTTADLAATVTSAVTASVDMPAVDASVMADSAGMSEKDTAILSTVTDTLKFITSGAKLGDTLPAGQTIQLPNVNLSNTLTQQTVQAAVNQAVTQTQVTTPANILAKQVTPVQVVTDSVIDTDASKVVAPVLAAINSSSEHDVGLHTISVQHPAQTASLLQNNTSPNTLQNQLVAQSNTGQSNGAILTAQQNMVAQQEVSDSMMSQLADDAKATSQAQSPLVTPLQTITTKQTTLATEMAQHQAVVNQQHAVVLAQTPVITESTQQNALNQGVAQATVDAALVAQQTLQNASNNAAQNTQIETSLKTTKEVAETIVADTVNLTGLTGENVIVLPENPVVMPLLGELQTPKSSPDINDQNVQQTVVDNTLIPDTLVAMQMTPQVIAQDAPVDQATSDMIFDKGSDNSNASDKVTTLTSAKTLLMDAVASRNNSGDAGNGNQNSNTPQNASLNQDKSLNQSIDNKQNLDAKSFASLLTTEKADVISVSSTDKATPQALNAAVNKLVQDVKADVAPITRPLSHPQWNEDLGERIVWMNSRGISSAEIKMNPENMGPISVRIDMNQDQATIAFTAQNSAVRDALEASLPKLREMLSAQQVNLADVSVSQQSTSNSDSGRSAFAQATADMSNGQGNRQNAPEVDSEGNVIASNATNETVDEFANGQVISTNGTNGLLSLYA